MGPFRVYGALSTGLSEDGRTSSHKNRLYLMALNNYFLRENLDGTVRRQTYPESIYIYIYIYIHQILILYLEEALLAQYV